MQNECRREAASPRANDKMHCLTASTPHSLSLSLSLSLFFHTHPLAAGGYKVVDGAANDATINEAAKFAVESVRIVLEYFLLVV
jgi:hypothetical protein